MKNSISVLSLFLCLSLHFIQGQRLAHTKCNANLPTPRSFCGVIYDGDDSIYVFGGAEEIVKYSISTDTTQIAARHPALDMFYARNEITITSSGTIRAFGSSFYHPVVEFNPLTGNVTVIGEFGYRMDQSFTQISDDLAIMIGSKSTYYEKQAIHINPQTLELTIFDSVHEEDYMYSNGVFDKESQAVYSTAYDHGNEKYVATKYNLETNKVEVAMEIPDHEDPSAVWAHGKMYLVDGQHAGRDDEGLAVFDPSSNSYTFLQVEGMNKSLFAYEGRQGVYVEKRKRIYLFGGRQQDTDYTDIQDIYFIDIAQLL